MARRYQVPNKTLGEFKIATDTIYTRTLCADGDSGSYYDQNFGALASCDEVPIAGAYTPGGVCVNPDALLDPQNALPAEKCYPLQLLGAESGGISNAAYVAVPWVNTWYEAAVENGVQCLCMATVTGSKQEGRDDGPVQIGISVIPFTKISGLGDIAVSSYAEVDERISWPINKNLQECSADLCTAIETGDRHAQYQIDEITGNVAYISSVVYKKVETSSAAEISDALKGGLSDLSSRFVAYLNNTLIPGTRTNPAYLSNETSSKTELADAFATKQDNLQVYDIIDPSSTGLKDVPTVAAVRQFVNSTVTKNAATFQGSFTSWSQVPESGSAYFTSPKLPDKNDYIYVTLTEDELRTYFGKTGVNIAGMWCFVMAGDAWDNSKKKQNWQLAYQIAASTFTAAQLNAMNSGITKAWKDSVDSRLAALESTVSRLAALLEGMSRQDWTFQLVQNGRSAQKTVLAKDL